jgi:hypothetical protein
MSTCEELGEATANIWTRAQMPCASRPRVQLFAIASGQSLTNMRARYRLRRPKNLQKSHAPQKTTRSVNRQGRGAGRGAASRDPAMV